MLVLKFKDQDFFVSPTLNRLSPKTKNLQRCTMHDVLVMDVCLSGDEYYIVECGGMNGAGFTKQILTILLSQSLIISLTGTINILYFPLDNCDAPFDNLGFKVLFGNSRLHAQLKMQVCQHLLLLQLKLSGE
jgi:hypothetical protein